MAALGQKQSLNFLSRNLNGAKMRQSGVVVVGGSHQRRRIGVLRRLKRLAGAKWAAVGDEGMFCGVIP